MQITQHAREEIERLAPVVGPRVMSVLVDQAHEAPRRGHWAAVLPISATVDAGREQWERSDRLAAIVRNGRLVTVMLTRSEQCHPRHFRARLLEAA